MKLFSTVASALSAITSVAVWIGVASTSQSQSIPFTPVRIAGIGDAVPGRPGAFFNDLETFGADFSQPALAANGFVVFGGSSQVNGAVEGLFSGNGGALNAVVRLGDADGTGRTLASINDWTARGGFAGFRGGTNDSRFGAYRTGALGGGVTAIALQGVQIGGFTAGSPSFPSVDASGRLAFASGGDTVAIGEPGETTQIAYSIAGTGFNFLTEVHAGDGGGVVFRALDIIPGSSTIDFDSLRRGGIGTSSTQVVGSNQIIPGTSVTWQANDDSFPDPFGSSRPVLNGKHVLFVGRRAVGLGEFQHEGVYLANRNNVIQVIAQQGLLTPLLPGPPSTFDGFDGHSMDGGFIAFVGRFTQNSVPHHGLFGAVGSYVIPIFTDQNLIGGQPLDVIRLGYDAVAGGSIAVNIRQGGNYTIYRLDLGSGAVPATALAPSSSAGGVFGFELDLAAQGLGTDIPIWLDPPATAC